MAEKELQKEKSFGKKEIVTQSEAVEVIKGVQSENTDLKTYENRIDAIREEFISELTPIENDVLSVAREILKKKRFSAEIESERIEKMSPMVEQIYGKSVARFEFQKGYKKETIFKAIKSLENKKWIMTGQRTTKEEILNNKKKKNILTFIEKYPGIHARDPKIEEELGITRNPFIKHIASLEAFGLIRSSRIGQSLNYFPFDLPDVFDDLAVLFHNTIVVDIVKSFIKNKNMTLMKLAENIGVYHRAIQYHIKFLVKSNVLIKISASEANEELKFEQGEKMDSRRKYYRVNSNLLLRYNRIFRIPPFKEWV
ncbi:MAG: hypothetical protein ACTSWY_00020 [Promethearchaeota archaeon]